MTLTNLDRREFLTKARGKWNYGAEALERLLTVPILPFTEHNRTKLLAVSGRQSQSRLLSIPQELRDLINHNLGEGVDVIALALTCKHFWCTLFYEVRDLIMHDRAPWAANRIINYSHVAAELSNHGLILEHPDKTKCRTAEQRKALYTLAQVESVRKDLLQNTLTKAVKIRLYSLSRIDEIIAQQRTAENEGRLENKFEETPLIGPYYPGGTEWVLRNLDRRVYVKKGNSSHGRIGEWLTEGSVVWMRLYLQDTITVEGDWAGDGLDIVDKSSADVEDWEDVSSVFEDWCKWLE